MNALAGTHISNVHATPLLHVQDSSTGIYFLVDTGAEVSVVLPNQEDFKRHPHPNRSLVAANGSPIDTYGVKRMVLKINHSQFDVEVSWFKNRQPSSENLVKYIWHQIEPRLKDAKLYRIRLHETPTIFTDYYGK